MQIQSFSLGMFQTNCYLLVNPESKAALIIDPGAEADFLIATVEEQGLDLKAIINTHCHIDHVGAVAPLQKYFKLPFLIHESEQRMVDFLPEQSRLFGIPLEHIPVVDEYVTDEQVIDLIGPAGRVIYTPGHSPGGISLQFDRHVFVGDCLFMDSIGRADLYMADPEQLLDSIRKRLLTLPEDTGVYPGHGPRTTIGREKKLNPFLQ